MHVDPAKYLLTRLCLRKPGKWHRLSSLRYQHELGENIMAILEMLCVSSKPNTTEHCEIKQEEQEIIDLTLHEMDLQDAMKPPQAPLLEPKVEAGPSSIKIEDIPEQPCEDLSFFAQDHTYAGLPELLNCLSLEELRQLAKDMKIRKPSVNVSSLPHSGADVCHQQNIRTAGSTRGRADETCILAIYFTVLLCAPESKGGKSARSTCTITPPQEVTVGPSASNGDEDPWYISSHFLTYLD